jgi:hypothetical protein
VKSVRTDPLNHAAEGDERPCAEAQEWEIRFKRHPCPGLLGTRYEVWLRHWYDREARVLGYIECEPWLCWFLRLGIRSARWQARRVHGICCEIPIIEVPW